MLQAYRRVAPRLSETGFFQASFGNVAASSFLDLLPSGVSVSSVHRKTTRADANSLGAARPHFTRGAEASWISQHRMPGLSAHDRTGSLPGSATALAPLGWLELARRCSHSARRAVRASHHQTASQFSLPPSNWLTVRASPLSNWLTVRVRARRSSNRLDVFCCSLCHVSNEKLS